MECLSVYESEETLTVTAFVSSNNGACSLGVAELAKRIQRLEQV